MPGCCAIVSGVSRAPVGCREISRSVRRSYRHMDCPSVVAPRRKLSPSQYSRRRDHLFGNVVDVRFPP